MTFGHLHNNAFNADPGSLGVLPLGVASRCRPYYIHHKATQALGRLCRGRYAAYPLPPPMRKQYHFRPSGRGLLIWDVDRLVALSADLPRREVPLGEIRELDEAYWFEGDGDRPTCRAVAEHARLMAEADLRYPIILCADGRVMDGMHRVAKAYVEGRESVAAVRFVRTPDPDYVGVDPDALPYDDAADPAAAGRPRASTG